MLPSKVGLDEAGDDIADSKAIGAGGECQRHAVLQDGFGERSDVIDRRGEAAIVKGAGTGAERERLAGARAGAP